MKCRVCKGEATIKLDSYNTKLCDRDFLAFFEKRIREGIHDYKMFTHEDRILAAISGGKDSLVMWDVLLRLGYNVTGYHLYLNIPDSSEHALEVVKLFAQQRKATFILENLRDIIPGDIREASMVTKKPTCSVCGMVKRYRFNRLATERGFTTVITGHHLDDESAVLLGNLMHWQEGYLARQFPVLEERPGMVRKAKPLIYASKEEIEIYTRLRAIQFASSDCPLGGDATSHYYKKAIKQLEKDMPSTKIFFIKTFYKKYRAYFKDQESGLAGELKPCPKCGSLTVAPICNFCALCEKLIARRARLQARAEAEAQALEAPT